MGLNYKSTQNKKIQRKKFESRERKMPPYYSEKIIQVTRFLIKNNRSQKKVVQYFSSAKRKELATQNLYPAKKYHSGMKQKSRHPQMKKN